MCVAVGVGGEPTLFPDGVDVGDDHVIGNGLIDIKNNGQGDQAHAEVRHIAPSVGQMAGVDPVAGTDITDNENLLTLKPRLLDLENDAANRVFVIAADQLVGGANVTIGYSGADIVISVANGSITTSELDLNSVDTRYVLKGGDTVSGDVNLSGNDLVQVNELLLADGSHGLTTRGGSECRFSGTGAGAGQSGVSVIGFGYLAACGNSGTHVNALGTAALYNEGVYVNAMGYYAAYQNSGDNLNAMGNHSGQENEGHYANLLGNHAGYENLSSYVNGLGRDAANGNSGPYLNALGYEAGRGNAGWNVTAMGNGAGKGNAGEDCFFAGEAAGQDNTADNVIAIGENISGPSLEANSCYLDGDLRLKNCNGKGGGTALHFANGTTISTTSDTIDLNGAKLANVIIYPPMGDIDMGDYTAGP